MGYQPGPVFKKILGAVEDLQLERAVASREDALRYVQEAFPLQEQTKP